MSERKNIDRLFQEKFKDFEVRPRDIIWQRIYTQLYSEKENKSITNRFKLIGVAVALVISIIIVNSVALSFSKKGEDSIVNEEKRDKVNNSNVTKPFVRKSFHINEHLITQSKAKHIKTNENTAEDKLTAVSSESRIVKAAVFSHKVNEKNKKFVKKDIANTTVVEKESITNKEEAKTLFSNQIQGQKKFLWDDKEKLLTFEISVKESFNNKNIADITNFTKEENTTEPNALEELLKTIENKENELVTGEKIDQWQITANVGPVYFNSASGGSSIDPQFANNEKSSEMNISSGIGVNYALSDKWGMRTGVNIVTLGYNTKDVAFYPSLSSLGEYASGMKNVTPSSISENIILESITNTGGKNPYENIPGRHEGSINQKMGYIEVPVEISYKIIDKKFGIQLIGGVSTLFLNENKVSVISSDLKSNLGEANNLNNIHFSSNIGLGFKYSFFKSLEANFEPMFKYQFNTFNNDIGDFKPYFVGIYTGISFSF